MHFIKIRSAADFQLFPGYREKINPADDPIEAVIQGYFLPTGAQCGLCGRDHQDGRIVRLKTGGHGNIGHICGTKWGESYLAAERDYQERVLRPSLLKKLSQSVNEAKLVGPRAADIAHRGAAVARQKLALQRRLPTLANDLKRRAANGLANITVARERSDEQIDDLLAANPRQDRERLRYYDEVAAVIAGLEIMTMNVHGGTTTLAGEIDKFVALNFSACSTDELLEWEHWLDSLPEQFRHAEQILGAGARFFTEKNFEALRMLKLPDGERRALRLVKIADLDEPITTLKRPIPQGRSLNRAQRRALQRRMQ